MSIPQQFIQDLVAKIDIVEIIQPRVPLKKRGDNFVACCPFHQEKSPSFSVSHSKQFYYCFGCGAHGNVIGFLMAYDRMEFVEAVEYLANQLGEDVPQDGKRSTQQPQQQPLYEALEKTCRFYQHQLRLASHAIDYLKGRGLTGLTAKQFRIGFAPAEWRSLLSYFPEQQPIDPLVQCGVLVRRDDNSYFDRFRLRIIFPIRDVRGRVIGFGGRALGEQQPKYLNSPETPIFHKSYELYGLYEAKQAERHLNQIIIVEGYMDVVSLHQHGITNAVATLGTACHVKHLQKLLRYSSDIVFCFDGDRAGRQAAWRALTVSLPLLRDGIHIRFLFLEEGEDPDSLVQRHGAQAFQQRVANASPLSDVLFESLAELHPLHSLDDKATFAHAALELIRTMPHGIFRQLLTNRLAEILQVAVDDLPQMPRAKHANKKPAPTTASHTVRLDPEKQLPLAFLATALLLQFPQLAQEPLDQLALMQTSLAGINLLLQTWRILSKEPELAVGQIMARVAAEDQPLIAQLAARPLETSSGEVLQYFRDTVQRLYLQTLNQQAQKLIEKAKSLPLTPAEREQLQKILATKAEKLANSQSYR